MRALSTGRNGRNLGTDVAVQEETKVVAAATTAATGGEIEEKKNERGGTMVKGNREKRKRVSRRKTSERGTSRERSTKQMQRGSDSAIENPLFGARGTALKYLLPKRTGEPREGKGETLRAPQNQTDKLEICCYSRRRSG